MALVAMAGAGCMGATARPRRDAALEPWFAIAGARRIVRTDAAGGATADAIGSYLPLLFPVAVAASFNDIYIADAGASRLYRYDRSLDAMAVLPEMRVDPATRLQVGADGSVYVLDAFAAEIRRYSRGGQALPTLRPRLATGRYGAFAVDLPTGKVYALDSAHLVVDAIQPLGQLAIDFLQVDAAGPLAANERGLLVASSNCGCVVEWIDGRRGRRYGGGKLRLPQALAVDGANIFVLDAFDRSIVRVNEDGIEAIAPAALGLVAPEGLYATAGTLLVADGAGHRVAAFRIGAKWRQ